MKQVFSCSACGAPISVNEGGYARCSYCGLEQQFFDEHTLNPIMDNAYFALEKGDFYEAAALFNRYIKEVNARDVRAYIGLLMAELHVKQKEDLVQAPKPLASYNSFNMALRFASPTVYDELRKYERLVLERLEANQAARYAYLNQQEPHDEVGWRKLNQEYRELHYRKSDALAKQCFTIANCQQIAEKLKAEEPKLRFRVWYIILLALLVFLPYFTFLEIDYTPIPTEYALIGAAVAGVISVLVLVFCVLHIVRKTKRNKTTWQTRYADAQQSYERELNQLWLMRKSEMYSA